MNADVLDNSELAEILQLDLWNEHQFQILATKRFYEVLTENSAKGVLEGDEPALASALIHTRSLLEFYGPKQIRPREDTVFWRTGAGGIANQEWQAVSSEHWSRVEGWVRPIHIFLGHISMERRTLELPEGPDDYQQRWPLIRFAACSSALLHTYAEFLQNHGQRGPEVLRAVEEIKTRTSELWSGTSSIVTEFRW